MMLKARLRPAREVRHRERNATAGVPYLGCRGCAWEAREVRQREGNAAASIRTLIAPVRVRTRVAGGGAGRRAAAGGRVEGAERIPRLAGLMKGARYLLPVAGVAGATLGLYLLRAWVDRP